jgi:hypothetical protein
MRGWSAIRTQREGWASAYDATVRAPICFDPLANRTILPQEELRADLGIKGIAPETIAAELASAYAPYYKNSMLGGHEPGGVLPSVASDDGTPFALIVIAVDDKLAIRPEVETGSKHH